MLLIKLSFIKKDNIVKVYNSVAKLDSTRTRLNTVRQTTSKTWVCLDLTFTKLSTVRQATSKIWV